MIKKWWQKLLQGMLLIAMLDIHAQRQVAHQDCLLVLELQQKLWVQGGDLHVNKEK